MATPKNRITKAELPPPTESQEQIALFEWVEYAMARYPELKLLFHVPNGELRNKVVAARLKKEGVRSGVPDLVLPVARGGYHGLYIEMKRIRHGKVSKDQREWLDALNEQNYCAIVCKGADEAQEAIVRYLKFNKTIVR